MSKQTQIVPDDIIKKMEEYRKSPFPFIEDMWGLIPQKIKKEKQERFNIYFADKRYDEITEDFFEPFIDGKNITWQQTLIIKAVENSVNNKGKKRISVRSGHGVGKFIKKNETVYLAKDSKINKVMAKDIKVGDSILGRYKTTKVIGVYPQRKQEAYRVTFDDNSFLEVGNPHLWAVKGRQERRKGIKEWRVLTTKKILDLGVKRPNGKQQARQWEIPQLKVQGFREMKDAYIIGAWYGDGSCGTSGYTEKERKIVNYFKKLGWKIKSVGKAHTIYNLITRLKEIGADYKHKNFLPKDFMSWDYGSRVKLLQGLCDTDGTIQENNIEFGTIRKGLAEDTMLLIRSLGGKARIRIKEKPQFLYKGEKRIGQKYYRVSFQTPFNPFKIDTRNKDLWQKPQDRYLTRWIDKIEKIEDISGICFKVDATDELFIAGDDLILTHNTTTFSWILLWYLFCFLESQIAATAPSQTQMYDALWKEVYKQLKRMPPAIQKEYDWQSSYIRMVASPQDWFARARTARKENPEALAGVHGDNVLILVDEASAVHEAIFNTIEGALTEEKILVLMISNPTRNVGYFYESQLGDDMIAWERFKFSTTDCPRVSDGYEERIISKHGKDSDEYRIRVLGEFPDIEQVDEEGYSPLFMKGDIKEIDTPKVVGDTIWVGTPIMGLDPAGEGNDETVWVIRDSFKAKIVLTKKISDEKQIAAQTATLMGIHGVKDENVYIDSFGIGHKCALELTRAGFYINAINVGDSFGRDTEEYNLYINIRAKNFYCLRNWARAGGEFIRNPIWQVETPSIKYRRQAAEKSRIQIMSKVKMKKLGYKSPDNLDALAITFTEDDGSPQQKIITITKSQMAKKISKDKGKNNMEFDPYSAI